MSLLAACYILCSRECSALRRATFRQLVAGLSQRWEAVMGEVRPVCLHILEEHWPDWLELVIGLWLCIVSGLLHCDCVRAVHYDCVSWPLHCDCVSGLLHYNLCPPSAAYYLRTEGGERLNGSHSAIFGTRSTQWTPMIKAEVQSCWSGSLSCCSP